MFTCSARMRTVLIQTIVLVTNNLNKAHIHSYYLIVPIKSSSSGIFLSNCKTIFSLFSPQYSVSASPSSPYSWVTSPVLAVSPDTTGSLRTREASSQLDLPSGLSRLQSDLLCPLMNLSPVFSPSRVLVFRWGSEDSDDDYNDDNHKDND